MESHKNLKPYILARSGMVLYETLVNCDKLQSPERTSTHCRLSVSCYYEFPLHKPNEIISFPRVLDAVSYVSMSESARKFADSFSVGIEIKESEADMYAKNRQIEDYVGYTDYLFLAVKHELIEAAVQRTKDVPSCGVFDIMSGKIYKPAIRQNIGLERKNRLLETFMIGLTSQDRVHNAISPEIIGANAFAAFDMRPADESRTSFWKDVYEVIDSIDKKVSALPQTQKMTSYYEVVQNTVRPFISKWTSINH